MNFIFSITDIWNTKSPGMDITSKGTIFFSYKSLKIDFLLQNPNNGSLGYHEGKCFICSIPKNLLTQVSTKIYANTYSSLFIVL